MLLPKLHIANINRLFVRQWLSETPVTCYSISNDGNVCGFALLHKVDYDPLGTQTNPKVLDFIYVLEPHRRQGHALELLKRVKEHNEVTAFCNSKPSIALFAKAGYVIMGEKARCGGP